MVLRPQLIRAIERSLIALFSLAALTSAMAQDPSVNVKDIMSFTDCLNQVLPKAAKQPATISQAVMCVPKGCKLTATMSSESAQAACSLGGCQLPRVIFNCPGTGANLRFRPSFLLCPVNNKTGDIFGTDRIEAGEDTAKVEGDKGAMKMADIPVPPGTDFTKANTMIKGVLSVKGDDKGCNLCHDSVPPKPVNNGDPIISTPIDTFSKEFTVTSSNINTPNGTKVDLTKRIIFTTEPGKQATPDAKGTDGKALMKVDNLKTLCDCIETNGAKIKADANDPAVLLMSGFAQKDKDPVKQAQNVKDVANPNLDPATLLNLCRGLQSYSTDRACGNATNGQGTALACADVNGGGKFLTSKGAVSSLVFDISGQAQMTGSNSYTYSDFDGLFSAYDYASRTTIDPVVIESLSVTASSPSPSADLTIAGTGLATVNGTPTEIQFDIQRTAGVITYLISETSSGMPLASGTGETGLSTVSVTVNGPGGP